MPDENDYLWQRFAQLRSNSIPRAAQLAFLALVAISVLAWLLR